MLGLSSIMIFLQVSSFSFLGYGSFWLSSLATKKDSSFICVMNILRESITRTSG